jgi:hypothetical protein
MDDIIFDGSSHALVAKFADTMSRKFEMSMMGELTFFSGYKSSKPEKDIRTPRQVHQGRAQQIRYG